VTSGAFVLFAFACELVVGGVGGLIAAAVGPDRAGQPPRLRWAFPAGVCGAMAGAAIALTVNELLL